MNLKIHLQNQSLFQNYQDQFMEDRRIFPLIKSPFYYKTFIRLFSIKEDTVIKGFLFQYSEKDTIEQIETAIIILPSFRRTGVGYKAIRIAENISEKRDSLFRVNKRNEASLQLFSSVPNMSIISENRNYILFQYSDN